MSALRVYVVMGYDADEGTWVPCEVFVYEPDAKKFMADERAKENPPFSDYYHTPRRLRT